jgi:hypothetical protein
MTEPFPLRFFFLLAGLLAAGAALPQRAAEICVGVDVDA